MKMKKNLLKKILMAISFILITISTSYIVYAVYLLNGIENFARILFMVIVLLIWVCAFTGYLKALKKPKSKYKTIFAVTLIYSILLFIGAYYINDTYNTLRKMSSNSTNYTSSVVTLKDNKAKKIKDVGNSTLGIINDKTSVVGNQMPLEIIEKNNLTGKVEEYDSFIELIKALLNKEIQYAFLPANYDILFSNMDGTDFGNLKEKTKVIYSQTKKIKSNNTNNNKIDKPFTILLMGVDSEQENIANASFNGDSLMLITFNPTTLSSTILSIPRDSYVPIACFPNQRKNKITHAAWYGEECMINTIQNFTGITIDYYVKINFKGVVKLVDTLGGVDIDVPYAFCEQNSNREWGKNTVYVEEGLQTLNGEQALAFARNRHTWPNYCPKKYSNYISNDFIRGQHQQMVVKALLNKLKNIKNLNTVSELMDTVSSSMETNMTTSEILSLYNIGKDILTKNSGENVADLLSMQRLYLNGYDAYIYDQAMKLDLYNYVLYTESLNEVIKAMKINLGLENPEIIKEFSFSIDNPYEETVIGKDTVGKAAVSKLPDFTGDTEAQARATCNKLGISVNFKYVSTGTGTNNTVIGQNYKSGYDVSYINSLTLTILRKEETKTETKVETPKTETKVETPKTETKIETPKTETKTEDKKEDNKTNTTEDKEEITIEDVTGTKEDD